MPRESPPYHAGCIGKFTLSLDSIRRDATRRDAHSFHSFVVDILSTDETIDDLRAARRIRTRGRVGIDANILSNPRDAVARGALPSGECRVVENVLRDAFV